MKIINRVLNGADGVEEISVVSSSVFGADSGRLCDDELLSLKFPLTYLATVFLLMPIARPMVL